MMSMPIILSCDAAECAYNSNAKCHAMAITVGSPMDRKCDTFLPLATKGGVPDMTGQVGACKVASCKFNQSLECSAPGVTIGREGGDIDCLTFIAR